MSKTFYVAICLGCEPPMPMPFPTWEQRDEWLRAHSDGAGHVKYLLDTHEVDVPDEDDT